MKGIVQSLLTAVVIGATASTQASALCIPAGMYSTGVTGPVAGTWVYNYQVTNGCATAGYLTDLFLPYFSDAGISSFVFPDDNSSMYPGSTVSWSVSVDPTNNLFHLAGAGVIDFHVTVSPELAFDSDGDVAPGVPGGYFANGFGFTASYGEVEAPSAAEIAKFDGGTSFIFIDPPIPGSPDAIRALDATTTATPEPATLTLLATGLVGMAGVAKRRKSA